MRHSESMTNTSLLQIQEAPLQLPATDPSRKKCPFLTRFYFGLERSEGSSKHWHKVGKKSLKTVTSDLEFIEVLYK